MCSQRTACAAVRIRDSAGGIVFFGPAEKGEAGMKRFRSAFGAMAAAICWWWRAAVRIRSRRWSIASTTHGTLVDNPPLRIASLDAATFQAQLGQHQPSGQQLLQVTGSPTCGVDFYYIRFWTVGGGGRDHRVLGRTDGADGRRARACSGPRPIVLYAHGTQTLQGVQHRGYHQPGNTEGALIAAMFAAQGYIVVAPNYAGYDISTLGYHPFLNAAQQSGEMMDILTAARTALPKTFAASTKDSGKLFITGLFRRRPRGDGDTARACRPPVTTSPPPRRCPGRMRWRRLSTPCSSATSIWARPVFAPLVTTSYQHAYGNIYTRHDRHLFGDLCDGYRHAAAERDARSTRLLPDGKLPQTALFDSTTPVVTVPGTRPRRLS